MNFPNLSVDSFYKFLTVLAIVALVFGSKMIADRFVEFRQNQVQSWTDSLSIANEIKNLELELVLIQRKHFGTKQMTFDSLSKGLITHKQLFDKFYDSTRMPYLAQYIRVQNKINYSTQLIKGARVKREDSHAYLEMLIPLFTFLLLFGVGGLLFGFYNWYNNQQIIRDKELLKDYINLGTISMTCQSCAKALTKDSPRPKEKDNSYNLIYCVDCYQNGEFTDPDISKDEMKEKIIGKLRFKNRLAIWWRLLGFDYSRRWKVPVKEFKA